MRISQVNKLLLLISIPFKKILLLTLKHLKGNIATFFVRHGIIDHPQGNLRQGGDKVVNLLVLDVVMTTYKNENFVKLKMGCLSSKVYTYSHMFVEIETMLIVCAY